MKTNRFLIRRTVSSIVTICFILCAFVQSAQATTYYISSSGNDATGTGTSINPWKTLYKACNTVSVSGDIIHVNAGTYLETVQAVLKPGVSIEGDGVTSILKSTLTADFTAMLSLLSAAEGTNGNQHISNLKFDGRSLSTFWCIYVGGRSNVSIHDVTFVDFKETGVIFTGRVDNAELAPTTYATGNSFYNNTMLNCSLYYTYGRGNFDFAGQDGMLIYNNTITQNQRPAGSNGYCVKFTNNGFNKGCKIYGNNFTRAQGTGGDYDFCVEMGNTSGLEVYNNIFNGGALDMNFQTKGAYAYSVWIHDNQFLQPAFNPLANQNGVILEYGTEGVIIENNVFSKQNYGISFTPRDGSVIKNIIIRKNLMTGISGGVWNGYYVTFGGVGNSFTVDSVDIYNNTMEYDRSQRFSLGISLPQATAGTFSNINIINNIIAGGTAAPVGQAGTTSISNLHIQYNDFYNNGNSNNAYFVGPALGPGYIFGNNNNNVATYAANYTLPNSSPLIDAGTYVGLSFFGAAPDKGYAETNTLLPVKLLDLAVTENKGTNLLQWQTASESNSDKFNIERSSDGQHYEIIGTVNASGYNTSIINYNFIDATPLSGINYYRLAMIDKDASKEYSNIVSISNKKSQELAIITAQLPTNKNSMQLTVASSQNQKATLRLFDATGRIFFTETVQLQKGITAINKSIATISNGIYYIKLTTTDDSIVKNVLTN